LAPNDHASQDDAALAACELVYPAAGHRGHYSSSTTQAGDAGVSSRACNGFVAAARNSCGKGGTLSRRAERAKFQFDKQGKPMRVVLVALALTVLFAAPVRGHEPAGTLQQIAKTGKFRIGFRESSPPMSFLDKSGNPAGYSIDLCKRIATGVKNKIGKEVTVEYVPVTSKNRFDALVKNKIDILCGPTTKTLSRAKRVGFTQLTFVTGTSFMTMPGKEIREVTGFNGKKIGVSRATTTEKVLTKLLKESLTDAEVVLFNSTPEGVEALKRGEIDAFFSDQVVLMGVAMTSEDKLAISSAIFSFEPFALAVRRDDDEFRLVADEVLSHLYRSGLILEIYNQWFSRFSKQRPPIFDALYQLNATPE
jgi:ABC-type amino acid transport substrate-binding protein